MLLVSPLFLDREELEDGGALTQHVLRTLPLTQPNIPAKQTGSQQGNLNKTRENGGASENKLDYTNVVALIIFKTL